jgi:hypothetical protein
VKSAANTKKFPHLKVMVFIAPIIAKITSKKLRSQQGLSIRLMILRPKVTSWQIVDAFHGWLYLILGIGGLVIFAVDAFRRRNRK